MYLLFNMLLRLVISFLPRSKRLLISWLQSPFTVIMEHKKIKSVTVSIVSPSICHEVMGLDVMILVFWMLSFKPAFSLFSFTFKRFKSYYKKWPQGDSISSCPTLAHSAGRDIRKILFADGQECSAPESTLKACVSSHSFFPFPFIPQSTSQFLEHHSVEGAITCRWDDHKEGGWQGSGGGGTPAQRTYGAQGTFQISSSLEVPPFFWCSRLDFSAGGPSWIQRLGTQSESKRHSRSIVGAHFLPHPPSSLSSTTLQPWYRSLLCLQGCNTSPGHHGLKELVCLVSFLLLL